MRKCLLFYRFKTGLKEINIQSNLKFFSVSLFICTMFITIVYKRESTGIAALKIVLSEIRCGTELIVNELLSAVGIIFISAE